MHRWLAVALMTLAACPPPAPPRAAAPKGPTRCERASDNLVQAMVARLPRADPVPTETADALRNLIRERCEQDAWSDDATRCLIAMKRTEDAGPCAQLMTDAQQAALVRDEEALFGGPSRPSSPPAEPAPASSDGTPPKN
jgi:hypothetical protein